MLALGVSKNPEGGSRLEDTAASPGGGWTSSGAGPGVNDHRQDDVLPGSRPAWPAPVGTRAHRIESR